MSSFASMFNLNKLMQDEGEPDDTMVHRYL
ncbi:ribonuclease [Klebsiella phage CPRSB]|nr:ribonuclease [Klebsiella phage CPRSB]